VKGEESPGGHEAPFTSDRWRGGLPRLVMAASAGPIFDAHPREVTMMSHSPLEISPLGPTSCSSYVWRQGTAQWATIIVKATFDLVHGEVARPVAPLPVVTKELFRGPGGSLEAADELAPYLPNVGVVLSGHAYAPGGRAATSAAVRLGIVGARPLVDKTLHVFGDRASPSVVTPAPFEKMPIVYERAYGGPDVAENPVGVGAAGGRLPNIVDPVDPRRPGGFGPIAKHWPVRRRMLGSFDAKALDQPAPEIPPALNWKYFHAAPAEQQFQVLHGEEWIVLDGMHPTSPRIQARLPVVVARAEWHARTAAGAGPTRSIDLRADTLVIDADRLVCSVLWRGRLRLERPEALHEIRVLAGLELPGPAVPGPRIDAPPGAQTEQLKVQAESSALAGTTGVDFSALLSAVLPFSPGGASPGPDADAGRPTLTLGLVESSPAAAPAPSRSDALSGTAVLDVSHMQAPSTPFERTAAAAGGTASASMDSPLAGTLGPSSAMAIRPSLPFVPADPSRPPEASVPGPSKPGHENPLSGTTEISFQHMLRSVVPFGGTHAARDTAPGSTGTAREEPPLVHEPHPEPGPSSNAEPVPPAKAPPPSASAPAQEPPASGVDAAPEAEPLDELRAAVLQRLNAGRLLHDLDLAGADLHGLNFDGAMMSGLDLRRANLCGASFVGARLTGVHFEDADLTQAVLTRANLSHANLSRAVLVRADLREARAADANFTDADLREAKLEGMDRTRTTFQRTKLPGDETAISAPRAPRKGKAGGTAG
jgi:hypothetical protein